MNHIAFPGLGLEFAINPVAFTIGSKPVSYTHLDVYKRQVEAYPNKEFVDTEQDFMGPIRLYEKNGFSACYEADDKLVMRKKLK